MVAVVVLLAAVATIVLAAGGGGESDSSGTGGSATTATATTATHGKDLLDGIPQRGTSLGNPKAKVVITEYADLQCPFCAQYATDVLPRLIQEYVRPGKVRLELRLLRFIGPDSDRGAQAAQVAAEADRMWPFADLWYRHQGPENSGYADDDFIHDVAEQTGAPAGRAVEAANSGSRDTEIAEAEQEAKVLGVESTPSFVVGTKPGQGVPLQVSELSFEAFEQALAPHLR